MDPGSVTFVEAGTPQTALYANPQGDRKLPCGKPLSDLKNDVDVDLALASDDTSGEDDSPASQVEQPTHLNSWYSLAPHTLSSTLPHTSDPDPPS